MCELFGFSGIRPTRMNPYLKEFFSHSEKHPHGWGLAVLYDNGTNLEKEPLTANNSGYLRERLLHRLAAKNMMAHIRLATKGGLSYENSHPFVMEDIDLRTWTLIHNGTIFLCPEMEKYRDIQEGKTDSERILCHIISRMNHLRETLGRTPDSVERFEEMDAIIHEITPNNKVNLLVFDGEQFYVHTNMRGTLFMKQSPEGTMFATVPLDDEGWEPVPFMQLLAFKEGQMIMEGRKHSNEYILNVNDNMVPISDYSYL